MALAGSGWKLWSKGSVGVTHQGRQAYSAVCWGALGDTPYFALGCVTGHVQAWDPGSGEMLGPLAPAFRALAAKSSNASVSGLAPSQAQRGSVFAASHGRAEILEIGLLDGITRMSFKAKPGALLASSLVGEQWLVSGGPTLKLWSVASEPVEQGRFSIRGVPTCLSLCCAADSAVVLCADGSAQVDVLSPGCETSVLSCAEEVREVRGSEELGRLRVLGCGASCVVLWAFRPSTKARTLLPKVCVRGSDLCGRVLTAVSLSAASALVAFGPSAKPTVQEVSLARAVEAPTLEAEAEPAAPEPERKGLLGKVQAAAKPKAKAGVMVAAVVIDDRKAKKRAAEEDVAALSAKRGRKEPEQAAAAAAAALSIAPILRQGLVFKGRSIVNELVTDRRVIDTTLKELSGNEAFDLLQELTPQLVSKPAEGPRLNLWIKRILAIHCGFIASRPALQEALQPLLLTVRRRLASHRTLLRLCGRLRTLANLGKQQQARLAKERDTNRAAFLEYQVPERLPTEDGADDSDEADEAEDEPASSEGAGDDLDLDVASDDS